MTTSSPSSTTIVVRSRDSLLTTSSGYTNYRGILNLVIILLVLSNARAALENVIKYGILVDPLSWLLFLREGSKHWPALLIVLGLSVHITISLLIEKLIAWQTVASKGAKANHLSSSSNNNNNNHVEHPKCPPQREAITRNQQVRYATNLLIVTNLLACIALPPIAIYTHDTHPISTSASLMLVSIVFLKLLSYHMMNFWCRDLKESEKLQSRTTRSFLKSYTPPAIEFGAIKLSLDEPAKSGDTIKTLDKDGGTIKANGDMPAAKEKASQELRQRLNGSNNTNHAELSKSPPPPSSSRNQQVREIALKILSRYPQNVTMKDMCSYMMFPTLCYELEFAKTQRIRKRFLIKRIVELLILSQMDIALVQQWIVPTVSNSVTPFRQMQFSHMLERLLKLAIPNHVIWMIWFYLFFHSLLNIVAELTRFADREFYRDWWNSESVYYFWSNWNIPVHKWCARHLYVPLISLGLTKCQASTAVFFVSAFFHEYLVSVPLKMFRMWAFTGMLIQLPWARFVSSYFNNHFANVAVWVSLIIGQPLCILMYYHDYYVINNVKSLPSR